MKLKKNTSNESHNDLEREFLASFMIKKPKSKSVASFNVKKSEVITNKPRAKTAIQLTDTDPIDKKHNPKFNSDVLNCVNYENFENLKSYIEPIPQTIDKIKPNATKFALYRNSNIFKKKNFL
jgi:hypothetical protein